MRIIKLVLGILFLSTNISFAADQKLDQIQIYELRKDCGIRAEEYAQKWKLCDDKGTYESHYNIKLNICFIYMTASCNTTMRMESLFDVNENKEYASYISSGKLPDDKPARCYVRNNHCKNLGEFWDLISPYMKE